MAAWKSLQNGSLEGISRVPDLDASKLTITLANSLKPMPAPESLVFGSVSTDHMLVVSFDPSTGWSAPEIKPYAPLSLDPMSSCFQYCTSVFEGMKAYIGPDGKARLFRPEKNMARLARSAGRCALPPFNENAVLTLIKRLVSVEKRWIPALEGYSLYIRPTIIGTRAALGLAPSDHALLYVLVTPVGPFFRQTPAKPVSLLAVSDSVRAWPGGTGGHKLGLNYTPGLLPQRVAAKKGYDQILWVLDDVVSEAGVMNVFVVIKREAGDGVDVVTPELDGTILPGVTRMSVMELLQKRGTQVAERKVTMTELKALSAQRRLSEVFLMGTAIIVASVGRIGLEGGEGDLVLPGPTPVADAMKKSLLEIQEGRVEFEDWSVICDDD
ncbi:branched-chain amino acid aminotransferase II [Guyanagaster necrorhizus]|uniref:Branched-chain-amino-acid aminotransferase n=1 Tax=Guyanagaster necrorhizus TaxID=856835 RepID=A0A9P8ALR0_9AGAR|nr:branched-chain amino acid aminotransferase II [Guyanagaster necrorhizus MCA 3950]KAG7440060.1 branched-chain amino acid aminotransferase II [Guyanagaster necrorhizus MCA 3950]